MSGFDKGSLVYKFRQTGKGTHKIIFNTMPKEAGNLMFTISNGKSIYTINQLIYP
ncbi:MAG: hypothetical protein JWO32_2360 [Bacteroidetes bacterium]|nr:hypothetical protein [Bacteroidota bacterium]